MARRGYTAAQVRAAEQPLLDAGEPLMRRAAAALAAELRDLSPERVLALVGAGDNGGDALFAVAELAAEGVAVDLVATASRHSADGAAAALAAGARWRDAADAARLAAAADVVLDGIVGIGSSPGLRGTAREVVTAITAVLAGARRPRVVAVDLPSGISPDDGSVPDETVLPADLTVTFGAIKAGLLLDPGARYAGRVVLVDLGLAPYLGDPVVSAE